MENRFTFRDFVFIVLLLVFIASIWIKMKQDDRQWELLGRVNQKLDSQTTALAQVLRDIELGRVAPSAPPATQGSVEATPAPKGRSGSPAPGFDRLWAVTKRPDFARGDWLVDYFGVQPPTLTPIIVQDVYGSIVNERVLESLAARDPDTLEWKPMLATGWQKSADGLSFTFQLRRDVRFSDGQLLTADDVVFTYNWIMNPKVAAARVRSTMDELESVTKTGDYEVVFKYKRPYFQAFELAASMDILPKHFYEPYDPEKFNESTGLLMGTGPYRLESPTDWTPGKPIVLVRNDRYWGLPNPFDRLIYQVILTESAEMTEFKNRGIDTFAPQPEQYKALLKDPEVTSWADHKEYYSIRAGYAYIAWNQARKGQPTIFANRDVRQAMTMLTDRKRICDALYLGYAKPSTGPFNPLSDQCDKTIEAWPYDVERAKALLKKAGFTDRGDGGLVGPDGKPFRVRITYPAKSELYDRSMKLVKDCYAEAGVIVDLDPQDWPILTKKLTDRDYEAISLAWSADVEDDIRQMFHSSQIEDNGDDFMSYRSPELDKLIDEARATLDEPKRMELWRRCHRIIHEDQPYTFLMVREGLFFYDKRFHNVERTRAGLNYVPLWNNPMEWYVPKALQRHGQ